MSGQRREVQTIALNYEGVDPPMVSRTQRSSDNRRLSKRRRKARRRNRIKKAVTGVLTSVLLFAAVWLFTFKLLPMASDIGELVGFGSDMDMESEPENSRTNSAEKQETYHANQEANQSIEGQKLGEETTGALAGAYPPELEEMLEKNPETLDFVQNYTNREKYKNEEVSLEDEVEPGEVPLLLQWDKRWGYNDYGQELVGLAGCGPTCMSMAYIYLTQDISMDPRRMAQFSYEKGFYTTSGTSWDLWTRGAASLGLKGYEISLDENVIKRHLDQGELVVCSMAPGDFTTTGHFILLCGYDADGFIVNDPNSEINSEKRWDFERLRYQIKCLWTLGL